MSSSFELVILIDARPARDHALVKEHYADFPEWNEAYYAASRELVELIAGTLQNGLGWLVPALEACTFMGDDFHKVDLDRGKLEWVFSGAGDFDPWLRAIPERWPEWKIAVSYDMIHGMSAGSYRWDGHAWREEHYEIADTETPCPLHDEIKALKKRDEWGRLDWGPAPVKET